MPVFTRSVFPALAGAAVDGSANLAFCRQGTSYFTGGIRWVKQFN
jgi:hypothetical protein